MACLLYSIHLKKKKLFFIFFVCFHPDKRFIFPFHKFLLPSMLSHIAFSCSIFHPLTHALCLKIFRNLLFVMMTLNCSLCLVLGKKFILPFSLFLIFPRLCCFPIWFLLNVLVMKGWGYMGNKNGEN